MNALQWLALSALFTGCVWIAYVLDRFVKLGIWKSITNPTDTDLALQSEWAKRARTAHHNAMENLAVFAPLVLASSDNTAVSSQVATAAMVYFFARAFHFVFHTAKVPVLRTLAFLGGFGAQLVVAVGVLS